LRFFHGTTFETAEKIIRERRFKASNHLYDWLGPGVYFFQDAPLKALDYASRYVLPRHDADTELAVVVAELSLENCFDLLRNDYSLLAKRNFGRLVKQSKRQKRPILREFNEQPHRIFHGEVSEADVQRSGYNIDDCRNIRSLISDLNTSNRGEFDCVRSAFWGGAEIFKGSFIFDHTNIQVCVLSQDFSFEEDLQSEDVYLSADMSPFTGKLDIFEFSLPHSEALSSFVRSPK
jgi:hypothetical protein